MYIRNWFVTLLFLASCNQPFPKKEKLPDLLLGNDSILSKIKNLYPGTKHYIQYSTSMDISQFSKQLVLDTTKCYSLYKEREFIGKIDNAKASVIKYSYPKYYLKTGNLKLWIWNLPTEIDASVDSVIISGQVFNIGGDETTVGFPTCLTKVSLKS